MNRWRDILDGHALKTGGVAVCSARQPRDAREQLNGSDAALVAGRNCWDAVATHFVIVMREVKN